VEVLDQPSPVIYCPGPLELSCNQFYDFASLNLAVCTAQCGPQVLPVWTEPATYQAGNCTEAAPQPIMFKCQDPTLPEYAGWGACPATFMVVDRTPPVISLNGELKVVASSDAGASVQYAITATDDCALEYLEITKAGEALEAEGQCTFPIGETVITCEAGDASGNVAQQSFTVVVSAKVGEEGLDATIGGRNLAARLSTPLAAWCLLAALLLALL